MRLRRFFVPGFRPEDASAVSEFLLMHGVDRVVVTHRLDIQKVQVDCIYAARAT